jgi:hypothetical protein
VNDSYVGRILRLTLLAPEIVDAAMDGRQPNAFGLAGAMQRFPIEWESQRAFLSVHD